MLIMISKEVVVFYVDPTIARKTITTAMRVTTVIENMFSQWDQVCSLVFLYEMYLCTCKMEARETSPLQLLKKILAAWIVPLLGNLYQLLPHLLFTGENMLLIQIMVILFMSFFHSFSMIASLYLGIHTAKALIKSHLFHRKQVAQPGTGRMNHLSPILLVATMSFVQCVRFILIFSRMVLFFQTMGTTRQCFKSALTLKDLIECALAFSSFHSKVYLFKSTAWLSIFEMASLVMPMLASRACHCRLRP